MPDRRTRVIRVTFESPPDPDRFHPKERCRFAVVVLFPEEVKRQLGTATAAFVRALDIAREEIDARVYKAPGLDALETLTEVVMFDLYRLPKVLSEIKRLRPWTIASDLTTGIV